MKKLFFVGLAALFCGTWALVEMKCSAGTGTGVKTINCTGTDTTCPLCTNNSGGIPLTQVEFQGTSYEEPSGAGVLTSSGTSKVDCVDYWTCSKGTGTWMEKCNGGFTASGGGLTGPATMSGRCDSGSIVDWCYPNTRTHSYMDDRDNHTMVTNPEG